MRPGFVLPTGPAYASPEVIGRIAGHTEALGFESLWVMDNDLFPARTPVKTRVYDPRALSEEQAHTDCPLRSLAIAAEQTERVTLGVVLANIPFQSPIAVAGSVAALDVVSGGRVEVGLGLGSTADEFAFVASRLAQPKSPAGEFLRALATIWECRANAFHGDHFTLSGSAVAACSAPVQQPRPRMSLTAFAPAAVQSPAALLRDGAPVEGRTTPSLLRELGAYVDHPGMPGLVIRAAVQLHSEPLGLGRALFTGSPEQVRGDFAAAAATGASALILDIVDAGQLPVERLLAEMETLRALLPAGERMAIAA